MCDAAMVPSEDATPVPHNGVILLDTRHFDTRKASLRGRCDGSDDCDTIVIADDLRGN